MTIEKTFALQYFKIIGCIKHRIFITGKYYTSKYKIRSSL